MTFQIYRYDRHCNDANAGFHEISKNLLAESENNLQDANTALQSSKSALELAEDARDAAQMQLQQNTDERMEAYVCTLQIFRLMMTLFTGDSDWRAPGMDRFGLLYSFNEAAYSRSSRTMSKPDSLSWESFRTKLTSLMYIFLSRCRTCWGLLTLSF